MLLTLFAGCGGGSELAADAGADAAIASNSSLAALTASDGALSPPFEPQVTEYELELPLAFDEVALTPTAAVPGGTAITIDDAAVASGASSDPLVLSPGTRDVDVLVVAADGSSTTYRVHVHRGLDGLAAVELSYEQGRLPDQLTPSLDDDVSDYTLELGSVIQAVQLAVTPRDPDATVTVFGGPVTAAVPSPPIPLNSGLTSIAIVVAIPGGPSRTHTLEITRGAALAQTTYVKASNAGAGDIFGEGIALDGDTLVVGAWRESSAATGVDGNQADDSVGYAGAAYVFTRTGSSWSQQAYLKASNTGSVDSFGFSVAISGETIAIGAPNEGSAATGIGGSQADNTAASAGAVYVFTRTGNTWSQQAYIKASNTDAGDIFGRSVALWGDTLVVGARAKTSAATGVDGNQADDSAPASGAAYVFTREGTAWTQQAYLKASNTDAGDQFGYDVALYGDTLAVSANNEASAATGVDGDQADDTAPGCGATYVFGRTAGIWTQRAYLKGSVTGAGDRFGRAIALWNTTLAVGAPPVTSSQGAVYVFRRNGTTWTEEARLSSAGDGGDQIGASVALWGDALVVGAPGEDGSANGVDGSVNEDALDSGAVYVYTRDSQWRGPTYVKASNTGAGDGLGAAVALWGDIVIAGAPGESSAATGIDGDQADDTANGSGASYVLR